MRVDKWPPSNRYGVDLLHEIFYKHASQRDEEEIDLWSKCNRLVTTGSLRKFWSENGNTKYDH